MRIYYFVHLTGRDTGNTGIQRVVRGLGRALLALGNAEVIPVRWSVEHEAVVHAEQIFLDTLAGHNGPVFGVAEQPGEPVDAGRGANDGQGEWLLIPEAPHLLHHDPRYPSVAIINPLAYGRKRGWRSAVVFHDILPLTHPDVNGGDEVERLKFTVYAQALVNADVVLPVSRGTGDCLEGWLANAGYRAELWPRVAPIGLPEEIAGCPRRSPDSDVSASPRDNIEFVTYGTICPRKNQLATLEAFNRAIRRRPELRLTLHVVGHSEPALVSSVARQIGRSGGRAQSHGYLDDRQLAELIGRARATIFVSRAEGYGLPVAESLWLGTPCLCSNIAPIAEIAEGGGCFTVDPNDVDAISAAIERLATDDVLHRTLLSELVDRKFRTWADYASAVVAELAAAGGDEQAGAQRRPPPIVPVQFGSPVESPAHAARLMPPMPASPLPAARTAIHDGDREFAVTAGDLSCHGAYIVNGEDLLRHGDRIEFDAARSAAVDEPVLFFGPYITVEPGIYLLDFEGELDGVLRLRFTHHQGQLIKEVSVDSFGPLVCLALTRRYDEFEVVGERTAALKSFRLHSIGVRYIKP